MTRNALKIHAHHNTFSLKFDTGRNLFLSVRAIYTVTHADYIKWIFGIYQKKCPQRLVSELGATIRDKCQLYTQSQHRASLCIQVRCRSEWCCVTIETEPEVSHRLLIFPSQRCFYCFSFPPSFCNKVPEIKHMRNLETEGIQRKHGVREVAYLSLN